MNDQIVSTLQLISAQSYFSEGSPIHGVLQGFIDSDIDKNLNANNQDA